MKTFIKNAVASFDSNLVIFQVRLGLKMVEQQNPGILMGETCLGKKKMA